MAKLGGSRERTQVKIAGQVVRCPACDQELFERRSADALTCATCGEEVAQHELLAQIARWALVARD